MCGEPLLLHRALPLLLLTAAACSSGIGGARVDASATPDLAADAQTPDAQLPPDLQGFDSATADATAADLKTPPDLKAPQDLVVAPDLAVVNDLKAPQDLVAVADLKTAPDLVVAPDLADPTCLTIAISAWSQTTGDAYCQSRGLVCTGLEYYSNNDNCAGAADTQCWGSGMGACCATTIANHAGQPSPASARWRCAINTTPVCGNGKVEGTEACDNGMQNGNVCRPGLGNSCSYCSSKCEWVQITPATSNCITPLNSDWTVSGAAWCQSKGKTCTGTWYWSANMTCTNNAYTGCWGSNPTNCCATSMSDHAGFAPASAQWQCM